MTPFQIPASATALEILAAIEAWAATATPSDFWQAPNVDPAAAERQKLWHVLTAMRGPDRHEPWNGFPQLKDTTTIFLRQAALPTLARHGGAIVSGLEPAALRMTVLNLIGPACPYGDPDSHFLNHVRFAAVSLHADRGRVAKLP